MCKCFGVVWRQIDIDRRTEDIYWTKHVEYGYVRERKQRSQIKFVNKKICHGTAEDAGDVKANDLLWRLLNGTWRR